MDFKRSFGLRKNYSFQFLTVMVTMTGVQNNNCLFITVFCSVLIVNAFIEPIHGKTIVKRASDPVVADASSKVDVNDDNVKKFAQQGVEKLNESGDKVKLDKIIDATFFPPAGKLMYEIKMNVKSEKNMDIVKMCTVNVEKGNPDVSVNVNCDEIEDMPTKEKVDDPQVKKYAQEGVDKLNENSEKKVHLNEIVEATFFPPAGKLMYEIKIKVENKEKKDDMKICTVHVERESGPNVKIHVECDSKKMKRSVEEIPQGYIADKPVGLDVTKPDIVNYVNEGLKLYAQKHPDDKVDLVKIVEAFYTPVSVFSHSIKVQFRRMLKDGQKIEDCKVLVPVHNGPEPMQVKCDN